MRQLLILLLIGLSTACIVKKNPSQRKFIVYAGNGLAEHNLLVRKVHEPSWKIGYRYGAECRPSARRDHDARAAITAALQAWLAPLRELSPKQPLISSTGFSFHEHKDLHRASHAEPSHEDSVELWTADFRVTFRCANTMTFAWISTKSPPDVYVMWGDTSGDMLSTLTHELGHAFGLGDTYLGHPASQGVGSSGGLSSTVGTQPSSAMSVYFPGAQLGEDDKRGIVWLYKHIYEGQQDNDCFFADYVLEQTPYGCRPKYPLIFEVKHGRLPQVLDVLNTDKAIDINSQDTTGMTALHYAAAQGRGEVVKQLLAHKDIKPALVDKQGHTPLDLAKAAKAAEIISLLEKVTPTRARTDMNADGIVNILDLVMVSSNFGKRGAHRADIDGNGVVDVLDLVRVAAAFSAGNASPPKATKLVRTAQLRQWLTLAQQRQSTDPAYQRGLAVLAGLAAQVHPQQTRLEANYPNPFNPETWLPYQLAKPARVSILIHSADGRLVRKLDLGNLPAGLYRDKSRAAYWDGRNSRGELVASGVYFYTLSAGDFSKTRKMILRK